MHVARYFPEAYNYKVKKGHKEFSVVEIARERELPPILFRKGEWILTTEGIDCLNCAYPPIPVCRFNEDDWVEHMSHKNWVILNDFEDVLKAGKDFVRFGIIVS